MDAPTFAKEDAARFLDALAPDGELTFQTFDDAKRGRPGMSRVLQGSYWRNAGNLAKLNAKGAGCFVMVNRGDGEGRKADNVQAVRAVFLDLDGAPLAPVMAAPILPAIVCETSPGKHHAYWPVADMPLGDFRRAQHSLAERYGGDPAVCDLSRVMRLPGYVHAKGEPFASRLLRCDPVMPWRWLELADALGLTCTPAGAANGHAGTYAEGERNPALYRFACGIRGQALDPGEALRRVGVANAQRCRPPLGSDEVAAIVASAWQGEAQGFAKLPHRLMDCEPFRTLPPAGLRAVLALLRNHSGSNNGRIALTRSNALEWGLDKRSRTTGLKAAEAAGLIECTARGLSGSPGHRATPDLFRLLFLPQ